MFTSTHFFSRTPFVSLGGVTAELAGTSNTRRRGSKYSAPWVCDKCAKKHPSEMGCGEAVDYVVEGEVIPDPSDANGYYFTRTTDDVDAVLSGHGHSTIEEAMGCSKCKEGQRKKRRRAAEVAAQNANGWGTLYNMRGAYPVQNALHYHMGQDGQLLSCPISAPALDPSLNCMRDARGNAVCSDGLYYPPGCPHTPPDSYFTPGVTPDEVVNGVIQGKIPPPRSAGSTPTAPGAPSSGISTGTAIAAGAGALGVGALLFVLFR